MSMRTPLHDRHVGARGQMVPFGGWDMPLHYGSQIEEHHRVRRDAGIFDVSHMTVVDVSGAGATAWLRRLLANDVARLDPGQALYSCMLDEAGGVIDDLIAYRRAAGAATPYRLVVNAATRDKDLAWMRAAAAGFELVLQPRPDMVMLAVQGPRACERAAPLLPAALRDAALALKPFHAAEAGDAFVGRTGYTGEDGWEVLMPVPAGLAFWDAALAAGIAPCGLGARDTLRLEAGMNLYGQDMDESTSPLVSGLAWTVAWEPAERGFTGRAALERERAAGPAQRLVGLVLGERGVMRRGQRVATDAGDGLVTSGGFSPTMNCSIALARVPAAAAGACEVEIRGALRPARLVRPPFVRRGRVLVA
ncbi:MAG: glycine cleavage system aminomethyltransferase GcvT [Gammaproteobacteria bacterium]|nr:glycine cleavage system aminomethyltransferase GcvT [Gammaproteobacteria bacterium]QOJ30710.1 MAG: glycine cleavage system aminomethyltransferase GcvT [Gammaproteobacteria bacterium]